MNLFIISCHSGPDGAVAIAVPKMVYEPGDGSKLDVQGIYAIENITIESNDTYYETPVITVSVLSGMGTNDYSAMIPAFNAAEHFTNTNWAITEIPFDNGAVYYQADPSNECELGMMNYAANLLIDKKDSITLSNSLVEQKLLTVLYEMTNTESFINLFSPQTKAGEGDEPNPEQVSNLAVDTASLVKEIIVEISVTNGDEFRKEIETNMIEWANSETNPAPPVYNANSYKAKGGGSGSFKLATGNYPTIVNNSIYSNLKSGDVIWTDTGSPAADWFLTGHCAMYNKNQHIKGDYYYSTPIFSILKGGNSKYFPVSSHFFNQMKGAHIKKNNGNNGLQCVNYAYRNMNNKGYCPHLYFKGAVDPGLYCSQIPWIAWMDYDQNNKIDLDGTPWLSVVWDRAVKFVTIHCSIKVFGFLISFTLIFVIILFILLLFDIVYPGDILKDNDTTIVFEVK